MKRILYCALTALVCCLSACVGSESGDRVVVVGYIDGVDDGSVVGIGMVRGRMFEYLDTDTLVDGRFEFTFTDTASMAKAMNIVGKSDGFSGVSTDVWVVPGARIQVSGNGMMVSSWVVSSDVEEQREQILYDVRGAKNKRVIGSAMMDIEVCYDEMGDSREDSRGLRARIDSLNAVVDSVSRDVIMGEIDMMYENRTYSVLWMGKLERYSHDAKLVKLSDVYVEKLIDMYLNLSDELRESDAGLRVKVSLFPPKEVSVGDDLIDADMWDTEGKMRRLEHFRGRFVLLNFWAEWCPNCTIAFHEMREITSEYGERLTIVDISSDDKAVWEKVSVEKDITWVSLNDLKGDRGIRFDYGISGIPYFVLISPEGKALTSWAGYGDGVIRKKIDEHIR